MPAEWQLRAYRIDLAALLKLVGSGETALQKLVVKAGKKAKLDDDPRIEDDKAFADVVDEILAGRLDRDHACGYRIAMEAFAEVTGRRLTFDVNEQSKNYNTLTTYADRSDIGSILDKLGLRTLGRSWAGNVAWPWRRGVAADWPSAAYWTAAQLKRSTDEHAAARKRGALDERTRELAADAFFADDNVDVVTVMTQVIASARAAVPARKRPRCVTGSRDGLLVLCDGEAG